MCSLFLAFILAGCIVIGDRVVVVKGEVDDELAARANCFLIFGRGSRVSSPVKLVRDYEVDFTIPPKRMEYFVNAYCVSFDGDILLDERRVVDVGNEDFEIIQLEMLAVPK
ncbi:hypothetical protein D3C80_1141020 [compost metagenome]